MTIHGPRPTGAIMPPLVVRPAATPAVRPPVPRPGSASAGPTPPEGTDPALWSVLTLEERAFFVQQANMGPLTYRPGQRAPTAAPAPRGQRIDVVV